MILRYTKKEPCETLMLIIVSGQVPLRSRSPGKGQHG